MSLTPPKARRNDEIESTRGPLSARFEICRSLDADDSAACDRKYCRSRMVLVSEVMNQELIEQTASELKTLVELSRNSTQQYG